MNSDRIWTHHLSVGLVIVLTKVGEAVISRQENKVHIQRDLRLSNTEFGNFQKLRYWGLIAKYKNEGGHHLKGYWLLTHRGALFLRNKISVHKWVKTLDNELVERSVEEVFIKDIWHDYTSDKWQNLWLGEKVEIEAPKQLVMGL
jgi:hypothetical protein